MGKGGKGCDPEQKQMESHTVTPEVLLHVQHRSTCPSRSKRATGSKCPEACQAVNWCHPRRHRWPGMRSCLGCPQRASFWAHIPEPACLYGAGTAECCLSPCSCCGTVPLLRASPVHTYSVISSSWRRNSKLSKIKVLCSKSDCDSVISWEQTCWVRHCSCSSRVKMDGFVQWVLISWYFLNPLTCSFNFARFDYRTRQNHGARRVSAMQFLSELTLLHPEDCTERGSILTLPSDLITRNTLILLGSRWEYLTHLRYLLMFFFPPSFPTYHVVKQHGNKETLLLDPDNMSCFVLCFLPLPQCMPVQTFPDQSRVCMMQRFSQCQNVACWPGATLQFFTFMWHSESK